MVIVIALLSCNRELAVFLKLFLRWLWQDIRAVIANEAFHHQHTRYNDGKNGYRNSLEPADAQTQHCAKSEQVQNSETIEKDKRNARRHNVSESNNQKPEATQF